MSLGSGVEYFPPGKKQNALLACDTRYTASSSCAACVKNVGVNNFEVLVLYRSVSFLFSFQDFSATVRERLFSAMKAMLNPI